MSSAVSAAEVQETFITTCCFVSAAALLVYEHLITFDREYRLVWKRRFSAATLLFLLARYPLPLYCILTLPILYPLSTISCSALVWLTTVLQLLFVFVVLTFSSLRAYALSGRQWQIAALTFTFSLVPFAIVLFADARQVVVVAPPPFNCTSDILISPELFNILGFIQGATTIAAEMVVLAVTIHQTYWQRRAAAEANFRTPLHTVILRDGTVYFFGLLMMHIADLVLGYLHFSLYIYIAQFFNPITAIMITRFILNLREADASLCGTEDASRPSFVRSIQFAAFVEPLGATLDHELSFSAIDPDSLDEQGADRENEDGNEDVLGDEEEIVSGQTSIHEPSEAEAGPSRVRE